MTYIDRCDYYGCNYQAAVRCMVERFISQCAIIICVKVTDQECKKSINSVKCYRDAGVKNRREAGYLLGDYYLSLS